MLKAVYYYKGYKILTDPDKQEGSKHYFVFKLTMGAYQKMQDRRGTGHVSGVQCGVFPTFEEALEFIRSAPNNKGYRGIIKK